MKIDMSISNVTAHIVSCVLHVGLDVKAIQYITNQSRTDLTFSSLRSNSHLILVQSPTSCSVITDFPCSWAKYVFNFWPTCQARPLLKKFSNLFVASCLNYWQHCFQDFCWVLMNSEYRQKALSVYASNIEHKWAFRWELSQLFVTLNIKLNLSPLRCVSTEVWSGYTAYLLYVYRKHSTLGRSIWDHRCFPQAYNIQYFITLQ